MFLCNCSCRMHCWRRASTPTWLTSSKWVAVVKLWLSSLSHASQQFAVDVCCLCKIVQMFSLWFTKLWAYFCQIFRHDENFIQGAVASVPSVLWCCWLGGRIGIWPIKNWVGRYWRGYLSGAKCKWFAYGPADITATPSSLAPVKFRMVAFLVPAYPDCPGKTSWNRCSIVIVVVSCFTAFHFWHLFPL